MRRTLLAIDTATPAVTAAVVNLETARAAVTFWRNGSPSTPARTPRCSPPTWWAPSPMPA